MKCCWNYKCISCKFESHLGKVLSLSLLPFGDQPLTEGFEAVVQGVNMELSSGSEPLLPIAKVNVSYT